MCRQVIGSSSRPKLVSDMNQYEGEIVDLIDRMARGEIDLIHGLRRVVSLRHQTCDPDSEKFLPLRAMESETDHFPLGEARLMYSTEFLEKLDDERETYLADVSQEILLACQELRASLIKLN